MLTATPVNNSLTDLETLIKYFIRDDARFASLGIPSIREYIKQAQAIDPANLTPEHLFDLMDQVAVRRTRKFVKEHYANELIIGPDGKPTTIKFPQPKVRRIDYDLDADGLALIDAMVYALDDPTDPHAPRAWEDRSRDPKRLMLARYLSSMYTVDHDLQEYQITNAGLLRSGLLKRLESSPQALHVVAGEDDRLARGVPRRAAARDSSSRARRSVTGFRRTPTTSMSSWLSSTTTSRSSPPTATTSPSWRRTSSPTSHLL